MNEINEFIVFSQSDTLNILILLNQMSKLRWSENWAQAPGVAGNRETLSLIKNIRVDLLLCVGAVQGRGGGVMC